MATMTTTINDLMVGVRKLVQASSPELIHQKIIKGNLKGWDGWDAIAEAFVRALVIDSVKESLGIRQSKLMDITNYGFQATGKYSHIIFTDSIGREAIFFEFGSSREDGVPDIVIGTILETQERTQIEADKAYFKCRLRFEDGAVEEMDELTFLL